MGDFLAYFWPLREISDLFFLFLFRRGTSHCSSIYTAATCQGGHSLRWFLITTRRHRVLIGRSEFTRTHMVRVCVKIVFSLAGARFFFSNIQMNGTAGAVTAVQRPVLPPGDPQPTLALRTKGVGYVHGEMERHTWWSRRRWIAIPCIFRDLDRHRLNKTPHTSCSVHSGCRECSRASPWRVWILLRNSHIKHPSQLRFALFIQILRKSNKKSLLKSRIFIESFASAEYSDESFSSPEYS